MNEVINKGEKRFERIRSFVLRAGRTTAGQQRDLDDLGPHFLIPYQDQPLDLVSTFAGSTKSKILEIGFGMGETTSIQHSKYFELIKTCSTPKK